MVKVGFGNMSTSIGFSFWAKEKTPAIEIIIQVLKDNTPQFLIERPHRKWDKDDPDMYGNGWVFENGVDGKGDWFGEDFNIARINKNNLKLWVDCGKSGAIWQRGNKRYQYNVPIFEKIMKALDGVDCSDTYMLTSIDSSGDRHRTYGSSIRKEWTGKLA